jgi:hypothetical protein
MRANSFAFSFDMLTRGCSFPVTLSFIFSLGFPFLFGFCWIWTLQVSDKLDCLDLQTHVRTLAHAPFMFTVEQLISWMNDHLYCYDHTVNTAVTVSVPVHLERRSKSLKQKMRTGQEITPEIACQVGLSLYIASPHMRLGLLMTWRSYSSIHPSTRIIPLRRPKCVIASRSERAKPPVMWAAAVRIRSQTGTAWTLACGGCMELGINPTFSMISIQSGLDAYVVSWLVIPMISESTT